MLTTCWIKCRARSGVRQELSLGRKFLTPLGRIIGLKMATLASTERLHSRTRWCGAGLQLSRCCCGAELLLTIRDVPGLRSCMLLERGACASFACCWRLVLIPQPRISTAELHCR